MTGEHKRLVEDLFLQAAELPQHQRAAFIENACPDVETALEVCSLLAHDKSAVELFEDTVQRAAVALLTADPLIGVHLGPYRIVHELGKGGMGTVYLAIRDDKTFEKKVAVKVVKRGMDTDAVLDRFSHERRILANLDHPHICRLIDAGTTPDGRPYFVMEFVEGQPVVTYCMAHKLSVDGILDLFRKICDAVSCAHRNLVVHRDLKAGNILVTWDGAPKLLDFGIAKLLDPESPTEVTAAASRILTLDCASPEQIRGDTVTTSTDIYSLGILLFELLTGQSPWKFKNAAEAEHAICNTTPPKPSAINAAIPDDLDNIVLMALRNDPVERYRSVDDLRADILRYQTGRPVIAREYSVVYRGVKFLRRHWAAVSLGSLALLCLVAGVIYANVERHRAEVRLTEMLSIANQTLFDLHTQILHLPGATDARLRIMQSTLAYLASLSKEAGDNQDFRTTLGTAYIRTGDIQGYTHGPNLGDTSGALKSYAAAEKLFSPGDSLHLATLYGHRGDVLNELGRQSDALAELQKAVVEAGKSDATESLQIAAETHHLIAIIETQFNPDEAFAASQREMEIFQKLSAREPDNEEFRNGLVTSYNTMGGALNRRQRYEEALVLYQKGLAIREKIVARNPTDVALRRDLMVSYGRVGDQIGNPARGNLGDKSDALQNFQKARAIGEELAKADPSNRLARMDVAQIRARVGIAMDAPGRERESIAVLDSAAEAIAQTAVTGKEFSPDQLRLLGWIEENRGIRLAVLGEKQNAVDAYRLSLERSKKLAKINPRDATAYSQIFTSSRGLAMQLALLNRRQEALQVASETVAASTATHSGLDPALLAPYAPRSLMWLGDTQETLAKYAGVGDLSAAADSYTRCYNAWQKLSGRKDFFRYHSEVAEAARKALDCSRRAKHGRRS